MKVDSHTNFVILAAILASQFSNVEFDCFRYPGVYSRYLFVAADTTASEIAMPPRKKRKADPSGDGSGAGIGGKSPALSGTYEVLNRATPAPLVIL